MRIAGGVGYKKGRRVYFSLPLFKSTPIFPDEV